MAPRGPKRPQDDPKMAPRGPQEGPKTAPKRPQDASKNDLIFTSSGIAAKTSPRGSRDPPKKPPDLPRTPPGGLPEASGTPQEASQTASKGLPRPLQMQSICRYRCQCCSLCRRPFSHCNKLQKSLTRPPEASGMRYETRFSTGPSLVKMTTDRWKTRSSIHGYIHRSMHASAAQEPETRGGGQSPSGVFNPPPREVRTEQSALDVYHR